MRTSLPCLDSDLARAENETTKTKTTPGTRTESIWSPVIHSHFIVLSSSSSS